LWFEVVTKDGLTMEFGHSADSRLIRPDLTNNNDDKILLWRISKIKDVNGNYMTFTYSGNSISEITYTSNDNIALENYVRIIFSYTSRTDKNIVFESGVYAQTADLLDRITILDYPANDVIKEYQFNYGFENQYSFLKELIEQSGNGTKLNSTIFLYGDNPDNVRSTNLSQSFTNSDLIAGDFDADGKADVLAATVYYDQYLIKHHSDYTLLGNVNNGFGNILYNTSLPSNTNIATSYNGGYGHTFSKSNFLTNDFDGDGRDDVFFVETGITLSGTSSWVKNLHVNYTKGYNASTQLTEYTSSSYPIPSYIYHNKYEWIHEKGHFFVPGDFDGDGLQDYLLILSHTNSGSNNYKAFFSSPGKSVFNIEIANFGCGNNNFGAYYATSVASADEVIPIDMNGDGKLELLVISNSAAYIIHFQVDPINGLVSTTFSTPSLTINNNSKFLLGDFNGDRKTDLLIRNNQNLWNIALSDGKGFHESVFTFQNYVQYNGSYSDHKILVADFNGDGKSDILHGYNYFTGWTATTSKLSLYFSKSVTNSQLVFTPQFDYEQYDYNKILHFPQPLIGDFNGDGRADFVSWMNNEADIVSIKPEGKERLLTKITDGHNRTVSFNYEKIVDNPSFYNRETSLDAALNTHPINVSTPSMYCVESITNIKGNKISFKYTDALIHRSGKGFLGFQKINTYNLESDEETITNYTLNNDFATLLNTNQSTTLVANNQLLSETKNYINLISLSTTSKRYKQQVYKTLNINHLYGTASENILTYDNFGNITTSVSKIGTLLNTNNVNPTETTTVNTTYGAFGNTVPAKPTLVTVTSQRLSSAALTKSTRFAYNNIGLLTSKTDFYGLPKAITTSFTYDAFGNVITSIVSAIGISSASNTFSYDATGRFIIQKQSLGNSVSGIENTTYHNYWGKPLTQSDGCNTTTFTYDDFGRLITTILPNGNYAYNSLIWQIAQGSTYQLWTEFSGGKPDTKTTFDRLGRATQVETAGFNGLPIFETTRYDARGNVYRKSAPYYSTETPLYTYQIFDQYNRLINTYNNLGSTDFVYTNLGNGNNSISSTNAARQISTKTTDAAGKIINSIDYAGELRFGYNSWGQQTTVQIESAGLLLSNKKYDLYGNQIELFEKNSGTTSYDYNALAQLIEQRDANGNIYSFIYDDLGRLHKRTGSEGTTTYNYGNNENDCLTYNKLTSVIGFNNVNENYTYDALGRLSAETNTVDGTDFTTSYTYNNFGKVETVIYSYGFVKKYSYDYYGYITTIQGGNDVNSLTTIYTNNQLNAFGQNTDYTLGNGLNSTNSYNFGLPQQFYTTGIQDLNFSFQYGTNNLLNRTDNIKGFSENFDYDNLNRLTTMIVNGNLQNQISYDDVSSGASKGNIVYKTDVGNYTYSTNRINAVKNIDNQMGNIANEALSIHYSPYQRPDNISQGDKNLNITYGVEYDRIKTVYTVGHSIPIVKYFMPDYEKQIDLQGTRFVNFINGINGLIAIAVTENNNTQIHYVYTDHLGSIVTVTNSKGTIIAEQNFDAWGRNREPNDWNSFLPTTGALDLPVWLTRGYTGHEHLREFGLINMNARLYDPVVGRMLAVDNYLSDPFNIQAYNKYSYANNNPLIYTDPTGNFPWLLVGALVFATGNTVAHAINGDIDNFADGFKYFAQGAVAGALVGSGIGLGLTVPVLSTAIKAAAWIAGGSTALSFAGGIGKGIANGDWSGLANTGKILVGAFNLDENKTFFGGIFEGVSRFSWELPQTTLGFGLGQLRNSIGEITNVDYLAGATLVNKNNPSDGSRWGLTLGNFINSQNVTASMEDQLFRHEYGHTIQSKIFGISYFPFIGIASAISASGSEDSHGGRWYEMQANRYALRYLNKFYPQALINEPWNFREYRIR
jgi:RHS repeat-associated protein